MAKSFYTQGTGSQQTLNDSQDEKIPVYATKALAQADLANLAEGQIIATKDGTADTQLLKDYVNFRYWDNESENADANTLTAPGVYSVCATNPASQHLDIMSTNEWCVIYVTRVDNNANFVQQQLVDWHGHKWTRRSENGTWSEWKKIPHIDEVYNMTIPSYWSNDTSNPIYVLSTIDTFDTSYGLQHGIERHIVARIGGETDQSPSGRANTDFVYHIDTLADKAWMHVMAYDIRTNNIFSIEKNLGIWGQWENLNIALNSVTSVPAGTSFSNAFTALTWHLGQIDFSQLTSYANLTRSGKLELQGYYWGNFTATHFGSGHIGVNGEINYGGSPCNFSAFRDMATGTWKVAINGEYLIYDANGWLATSNNGSGIGQTNIVKVRGSGTLYSYLAMTDALGKTGATLRGVGSFTPSINTTWTLNNKHNNNSRTGTQAAGVGWGMENVAITNPDASAQSFIMTGENRFDNVSANLWGNDWTLCTVSAAGEFIG